MLRNWLIYILALLGAIIFFLFYWMWFSWFILMVMLLILPCGFLISIFSALFFHLETDAHKTVAKGDNAEISFTSHGLDFFPYTLYSVSITMTEVMTGEQTTIRFVSQCNATDRVLLDTRHCGVYSFSEAKVRAYDIFGLFFIPIRIGAKGEVIVKPIPCMPGVMPDLNGFKAKSLRKSDQPYSEIYDLREYQPGDPIKRIHWKISAKKENYMVKEPQEEVFGHSRIYLPLTRNRGKLDQYLGEVLFTSKYFLDHDIEHKIRVIPPMRKEIAFQIATEQELEKAILDILHMPIPEDDSDA